MDVRPDTLDRNNPLYGFTVDLKTATEDDYYELSHYPGGIAIQRRYREGKFDVLLSNRQQSDRPQMIRPLFEEVGLPVKLKQY